MHIFFIEDARTYLNMHRNILINWDGQCDKYILIRKVLKRSAFRVRKIWLFKIPFQPITHSCVVYNLGKNQIH